MTDCPKGASPAEFSIERKEIKELLDATIAAVATREYHRLQTHERDGDQCCRKMCKALEDLLALGKGTPPDYTDEWLALAYLTWYQPRQINLVASICLHRKLSPSSGKFLVVDVGCGAFATLIGMAIGLAMRGVDIPGEIVIHGVDPSETMKRMGKELLCELKRRTFEIGSNLGKLARLLDRTSIEYNFTTLEDYLTTPNLPSFSSYGTIWLTITHAAYDHREEEYGAGTLKNHVDKLKEQIRKERVDADLQHTTIVTGMDGAPVEHVAGGGNGQTKDFTDCDLFKGNCSKITSLRRDMADALFPCFDDLALDDKRRKYKKLLWKTVKWDLSSREAKIDRKIAKTAIFVDRTFVDRTRYEIKPRIK